MTNQSIITIKILKHPFEVNKWNSKINSSQNLCKISFIMYRSLVYLNQKSNNKVLSFYFFERSIPVDALSKKNFFFSNTLLAKE